MMKIPSISETKAARARIRQAPLVEYRILLRGSYGLYVDEIQFLSTPTLHVNGPGRFAYRTLSATFIRDFEEAMKYSGYKPANYVWCQIFKVKPDGTLVPCLHYMPHSFLRENQWLCIPHKHYLYDARRYPRAR